MNPRQYLFTAFAGLLLILPGLLRAGQQQESVADAARKAQAEKRQNAKPSTMVFTNDSLDTLKGAISVVGPVPTPPEDAAKTAADKAAAPAKTPGEAKPATGNDEATWRKKFADARKKLALDARELDVLQREYNLKQEQYYTDPNQAMREQYSRTDINDTKAKIDNMTAAVAQDKQSITDLEDALQKAGGDPGWSREEPAQPSDQQPQ
jgi:hypothetical protein